MSAPQSNLHLYVSEECALCDHAIEVLAQARAPDFECICIEGEATLEERYGARVPVLHDVIGDRELGWPFDVASVTRFLDSPHAAQNGQGPS